MSKAKITGGASLVALIKGLLEQGNNDTTAKVLSVLDDTALEKAAQSLKPGEHVKDRWEEGEMHRPISREEVKVGPSEQASGQGLEKMIGEYSSPAPQHGVQLDAEKFMRQLAPLAAASKAQTEALGHIVTFLKSAAPLLAMIPAMVKAEDEEEDDEEEAEVVEINASKAKSFIGQAQKLLRKAETLTAKAEQMEEEEEEEEAAKAARKAARKARREASIILGKARSCAYAAHDTDLKKSIRDIASKADINVVQEEEEEEEEESESGKSKAAKAKTNDEGHQADHQDSSNGNQAASAKAGTTGGLSKAEVDAAIGEAMKPINLSLQEMMGVLSGKSRLATPLPDSVIKSNIDKLPSLDERIAAAQAEGTLTGESLVIAKSIRQQLHGVQGGKLDESIVKAKIAKAPPNVRQLFIEAA